MLETFQSSFVDVWCVVVFPFFERQKVIFWKQALTFFVEQIADIAAPIKRNPKSLQIFSLQIYCVQKEKGPPFFKLNRIFFSAFTQALSERKVALT